LRQRGAAADRQDLRAGFEQSRRPRPSQRATTQVRRHDRKREIARDLQTKHDAFPGRDRVVAPVVNRFFRDGRVFFRVHHRGRHPDQPPIPARAFIERQVLLRETDV